MTSRPLAFIAIVLAGISGLLIVENTAVRLDQNRMRYAYGSFLAQKVKGKPLSEMIHRSSLAVFRSSQGMVACSILKGGE